MVLLNLGLTLIDQIFCKHEDPWQSNDSGIMVSKVSDHLMCITSFNVKKLKKKGRIYYNRR